jgi:hypothetical protein
VFYGVKGWARGDGAAQEHQIDLATALGEDPPDLG